jgi:hypothetical protein
MLVYVNVVQRLIIRASLNSAFTQGVIQAHLSHSPRRLNTANIEARCSNRFSKQRFRIYCVLRHSYALSCKNIELIT